VLARAMYRHPKILFVDEGTAHVDVEMEGKIYDNLGSLSLTLICIAHGPGALAYCDKVFSFSGGQVSVSPPPLSGRISNLQRRLA
jgi:ATP-binding cassette, subfamily B, bacterial CvaB/MchF/RaxB